MVQSWAIFQEIYLPNDNFVFKNALLAIWQEDYLLVSSFLILLNEVSVMPR